MVIERYETRFKAGQALSEIIKNDNSELFTNLIEYPDESFCFAIPNGGVPIAEGFCNRFNLKYDLIIVRKIKIPWNTEAGFGSITTDGTVLINEPLLNQLNLTKEQLEKAKSIARREIQERLELYEKQDDLEENYTYKIQGKQIFMMDDGLASGFTMMAAIQMVKKYKPKNIFIAVPTAPLHTVQTLDMLVDHIFCPIIREVWRFAVADAYKHWYDVPESEVLEILKKSSYYLK